jgi:hypothetical protein
MLIKKRTGLFLWADLSNLSLNFKLRVGLKTVVVKGLVKITHLGFPAVSE